MTIKPEDILLYTGAGLIAWLLFRGARTQTRIWEEKEEQKKQESKKKEIQKTATEFQLTWKDKNGSTRTANLDTLARYLESALRGSYWGEDEEQIRQVMTMIPTSVRGKSGITYPIRTIATRYSINTKGKDLKADLIRLLSAKELTDLGVSKHLKYL